MLHDRPKTASYIAHKSSKKRKSDPATARVVKPHGVLSTPLR